jgi:metacaspase-1
MLLTDSVWLRADAVNATEATGHLSWAFITAFKKNPQQSYIQLLHSLGDELATRYTQKPQITCSHPLSMPHGSPSASRRPLIAA